MSPFEKDIIRRKLAIIVECLKALAPIKKMKADHYASDIYKRKATERLLQEMIEAAIDINTHIIVSASGTTPEDYFQSFIKLGELGVIPVKLAKELAPSAGLRNRLVHEYDNIDNSIVLAAVAMADDLYPKYIKVVEDHTETTS